MANYDGSHQSIYHQIGSSAQSIVTESSNPKSPTPNEIITEGNVGDHTESIAQIGSLKSVVYNQFKKTQVNRKDKA